MSLAFRMTFDSEFRSRFYRRMAELRLAEAEAAIETQRLLNKSGELEAERHRIAVTLPSASRSSSQR